MKIVALLIILSLLPMSGCYDSIEIDDMAYVTAIGFEKGKSDALRMTVQISSMRGMQSSDGSGGSQKGKDGGGEKGFLTITVDTPSVYTGLDLINTFESRKMNLMHTKILVFSEELAKEGIGTYISAFVRQKEARRSLHIIVTKGSPKELIEADLPTEGTSVSKSLESLLTMQRYTGLFSHTTLNKFYNEMKSTYGQPIAILGSVNDYSKFKKEGKDWGTAYKTGTAYVAGELPRTGGGKMEILGTAVFDGAKMVGILNGDETRLMLIARGELKNAFFSLMDPKRKEMVIPLSVYQYSKPQVRIRFEDGKPIVSVNIRLVANILSIQSRINYENPSLTPEIEKAFISYIEKELINLIRKCQEWSTDIFNFGLHAVTKFGTIQEWEKYGWNRKFKEAEIKVKVDFNIKRTGIMLKSSPIISSKGKE